MKRPKFGKKKSIKLLGNRVLLRKPKGGIRTTRGGILLSENAYYDRGLRCEVIDCGTSKRLTGCAGKDVIVSHLVGLEIEIEGEKFLVVKDFDVLAVIEGG